MNVLLPTLLLGTLLAANPPQEEFRMMTLNMQYHHTLIAEMHKSGLLKWTNGDSNEGLAKNDVAAYRLWHDSSRRAMHSKMFWTFPTLQKQVEFVSNILARSQLKSFTADVNVIAVQEGFVPQDDQLISTEQIMQLLGFNKVVCSSTEPDASANVRDMVYNSPMWVDAGAQTHPLPKEILEGTLVNQIYVRRGSAWKPNGNNKVTRTSKNLCFEPRHSEDGATEIPDIDCDHKELAPRSVVSSELVCNGHVVRAMSTHISGGRFEDQYWEQDMREERARQVATIGDFIDAEDLVAAQRQPPARPVSLLAGDYNATPYPSDAMKSYGESPAMKIVAEKIPAFLTYMSSSLAAAVTHGFAFTYYDRKDHTITLDRFGSATTPLGEGAYASARNGTPIITGNTSTFGHVIDWIAVKDESRRGVLPGRVERIVLTKQNPFSKDISNIDNAIVDTAGGKTLTDHNAVKQTFVIGDMQLVDEADVYDIEDMSRDTIVEIANKLTATTDKVAYVGSPANLDNARFFNAIESVLRDHVGGDIAENKKGVYVGVPNSALFDKKVTVNAPVVMGPVSTSTEASQYTVLLTPGGPGAKREAAQFRRQGCRIIALTNSADVYGMPDWYNITLCAAEKQISDSDEKAANEKAAKEQAAAKADTAKAEADAAEERIKALEANITKTEVLLHAVHAVQAQLPKSAGHVNRINSAPSTSSSSGIVDRRFQHAAPQVAVPVHVVDQAAAKAFQPPARQRSREFHFAGDRIL